MLNAAKNRLIFPDIKIVLWCFLLTKFLLTINWHNPYNIKLVNGPAIDTNEDSNGGNGVCVT